MLVQVTLGQSSLGQVSLIFRWCFPCGFGVDDSIHKGLDRDMKMNGEGDFSFKSEYLTKIFSIKQFQFGNQV
jgi:hypothetical protein